MHRRLAKVLIYAVIAAAMLASSVFPRCLAAIPPPPMTASQDVALSADGRLLAHPGTDEIDLHDTSSGKITQRLKGCKCSLNQLIFSPDSRTLASNGDDCINGKSINKVHLWDTQTGKMLVMFEVKYPGSLHIGFTRDGKLVGAEKNMPIRVWDGATGKQLDNVKENALFITRDGRAVTHTHELDVLLQQLEGHLNYFTISEDGKTLGALQSSHINTIPSDSVTIWDIATGKRLFTYPGHAEVITMAFGADSQNVILAGVDNVTMWNTTTGEIKQLLKSIIPASTPHNATTTSLVKISENAEIVAFSTLNIVPSTEPLVPRDRYEYHLVVEDTKNGSVVMRLP